MPDAPALMFALILLIGFLCQWAAWRIKLPAILLLLLAGILMGPVTELINPDFLLGDLLFPVVSLSVAIILFEGSLTLRFREIREQGSVVRHLVTTGAVITWILCALACHWIMGFPLEIAFLFGAIVTVSGPTVIVPMLRTIRPNARISNVLRWEGIVIDPIGALLAVVVYEYIVSSGTGHALEHSLLTFARICIIGLCSGGLAALLLGELLKGRWLPEYLHNFATIGLVLIAFTASNMLEHESGLLTVTVMGIALANMRGVNIGEILSFKENLTLMLLSALFILLAARINLEEIMMLGGGAALLLAFMQLVVRPIAVIASSLGSDLTWQERTLLAWVAPRGIVAAAVSGLFALKLEQLGYTNAGDLVALTFVVIIGTVALQSATAQPLAWALKVLEPAPRGALIVGANRVSRAIGSALQEQGIPVLLADAHYDDIRKARLEGLPTFYGNPISAYADRNLDLIGFGRLLALSPSREDNVLASLRYRHEFGMENIFALRTAAEARIKNEKAAIAEVHKGAFIGGEGVIWSDCAKVLNAGGNIKSTRLSEEYGFEDFRTDNPDRKLLFAIDGKEHLRVFHKESVFTPEPGWLLISIGPPQSQERPGV